MLLDSIFFYSSNMVKRIPFVPSRKFSTSAIARFVHTSPAKPSFRLFPPLGLYIILWPEQKSRKRLSYPPAFSGTLYRGLAAKRNDYSHRTLPQNNCFLNSWNTETNYVFCCGACSRPNACGIQKLELPSTVIRNSLARLFLVSGWRP